VVPPRGEAGVLPVPDGTGLGGEVEVLAASSGVSRGMPGALRVRLRASLRKKKRETQKKQ
jgi:hypothetical protein